MAIEVQLRCPLGGFRSSLDAVADCSTMPEHEHSGKLNPTPCSEHTLRASYQ